MTTATQQEFRLTLPASRQLVPITTAMVLLDRDEDAVLGLIETGDLAWAWNIASRDSARREIRVWRNSLAEYLGSGDCKVKGTDFARREDTVLSAVFPALLGASGTIKAMTIRHRWMCSHTHVFNLISEGSLRCVPGKLQGALSSAVIRESAVEFLRSRCLHRATILRSQTDQ